jgi:hypothetical protein
MFRPRHAMLLAVAMAAAHPAAAAEEAGWVSAGELREIILNATITGRYDNGEPYSEYHAPDGRVLGHNNKVPNEEACWDIKADTVCYYYAKGRARGEFCWRFQRIGSQGIRAKLIDGSTREIVGVRQRGNPHDHTDNDKPWTCDPVTSERKAPLDPATRQASR